MKTCNSKSSTPGRVVRLGNARRQTKASFVGIRAELLNPDQLYTPGG